MTDYKLYYWSVPFRGQLVRAVLAYAGKSWTEAGDAAIGGLMEAPVEKMPVPFMGPPLLLDRAADVAIAQMPAIIFYLGETLGLLPEAPPARALAMKIVNDANDVLDELTLDGGRQMWTKKSWTAFLPRLGKWMSFWEETGRRHGMTAEEGFLLGAAPCVADIVSATLWGTMGERFPALAALLDEQAPRTAGLTRRLQAHPALARLAANTRKAYGAAYCGGQIEASLRKMLGA